MNTNIRNLIIAVVVLAVAPYLLYPVFLAKLLCFALFAAAFNLLLGYAGIPSYKIRKILFSRYQMNSNLELALRYAKHRDLGDSRPYTELAALSCLDEKTIRRCINEITSYYVTATRCTPAEAGLLDDRLIKHILSNT